MPGFSEAISKAWAEVADRTANPSRAARPQLASHRAKTIARSLRFMLFFSFCLYAMPIRPRDHHGVAYVLIGAVGPARDSPEFRRIDLATLASRRHAKDLDTLALAHILD